MNLNPAPFSMTSSKEVSIEKSYFEKVNPFVISNDQTRFAEWLYSPGYNCKYGKINNKDQAICNGESVTAPLNLHWTPSSYHSKS